MMKNSMYISVYMFTSAKGVWYLLKTKKLPIEAVSKGSGVERKTLERHRKYMVALLLAYTNGYEIIRGHLSRLVPSEEGHNI